MGKTSTGNLLLAALVVLSSCRRTQQSSVPTTPSSTISASAPSSVALPASPDPVAAFKVDTARHERTGRLLVSNLSGHDAIIRLRNPDVHSQLVWLIKPGPTTVGSIPNGDYVLQFCVGDGWEHDAKGFGGAWFSVQRSCGQISYPLSFEMSEEVDGQYAIEQFVTLRDPTLQAAPEISITRADFLGS